MNTEEAPNLWQYVWRKLLAGIGGGRMTASLVRGPSLRYKRNLHLVLPSEVKRWLVSTIE